MTTTEAARSGPLTPRELWSLGDYAKLAEETIGQLGRDLVEACGISSGQKVLDVAAGAGNSSIPAAARGASVTALDITPELLAAGERRATREGLEIEWIEGDAQDLPFPDGGFDVVMSSIGAMFAPDHQKTADELLRVCRSGGKVGMANWRPDGSVAGFFQSLSRYAPEPPPGWKPPTTWGAEEYVREMFGGRVGELVATEHVVRLDHFDSVDEMRAYYKENFGPVIAAYAAVADDPAKVTRLDKDYEAFVGDVDKGDGTRPVVELEYRIFVATKV